MVDRRTAYLRIRSAQEFQAGGSRHNNEWCLRIVVRIHVGKISFDE